MIVMLLVKVKHGRNAAGRGAAGQDGASRLYLLFAHKTVLQLGG